ncbi:hypothetical protein ACWEGE_33335 [Amycolatopsis sp. NPDC004747]
MVVLAVLVVIATVTAVAIAVLSGGEPRSSPGNPPSAGPTVTVPSTVRPPTVGPSTGSASSTPSRPAEPGEPGTPVLADGRYPAYLTAIDTGARTLTFDVIQFLTGEEATKAFQRDHPGAEGPPNGYYILNVNPRLRTLPVRRDVPVEVLWLKGNPEPETITFEQLPDYFAHDLVEDRNLWYDPFWLTVRAGHIDAVAEQFIP